MKESEILEKNIDHDFKLLLIPCGTKILNNKKVIRALICFL